MKFTSNKANNLLLVLSAIFLTNAIIAEFGGVKMFSAEKLLGIQSVHLLGLSFDFSMSVGALIWPVVFILSDLMNEYFGKNGVKRISILTSVMILWAFIVIFTWTRMPPAAFWLNLNAQDPQGNPFNIDYAYSTIFRQGLGIIAGSITAFLTSQLIDAITFQYLKKITGHKKLWLRATGSTIISQLVDSFVILFIAFYLFGNWPLEQVLRVATVQYLYKVIFAIVLTPLIYIAHRIIDNYLGPEVAQELITESTGKQTII